MFKNSKIDDVANRYIREKIRQARQEANESQDDLAQMLSKSRVTISDMERGRVAISASDLALISSILGKPIGYFFPPQETYQKGDLTPTHEELLTMFDQLPEIQQQIAIEYIKQQLQLTQRAQERLIAEELNKK